MNLRAAVAFALALSAASCGSDTGLNVRIEVPIGFPPEDAFDAIQVNVVNRDLEVASEPAFPITKATPLPYRVLIWLDDLPAQTVSVDVRINKNGQLVKQKRCAGVSFVPGRLREVIVDLGSQADCVIEP